MQVKKKQNKNTQNARPAKLFAHGGEYHIGMCLGYGFGKTFPCTLTWYAAACHCPDAVGDLVAAIHFIVPRVLPNGFAVGQPLYRTGKNFVQHRNLVEQ